MASASSITQSQLAVLSPLDQYMPKIYTNIFLVFETPDAVRAVDRLKDGLKRLNQRLLYLKGRVFATTDRGQAAIRWSPGDRDVELHEMPRTGPDGASLVLPGMSFTKLKREGAPLDYFPICLSPLPRVADVHSNSGAPVFAVNYTALQDGVVVGLSVQHNVMDGTGVVELIRLWAECTRTEAINEPAAPDPEEPLHRNQLLWVAAGSTPESKFALRESFHDHLAKHPEFTLRPQPCSATPPNSPQPVPPRGAIKIFTFSTAKLASLEPALAAALEGQLEDKWITTNTILCAVAWSCITRIRAARHRREHEGTLDKTTDKATAQSSDNFTTSKLGFAVNARTRLPDWHHGRPFLGNTTMFALAEMSVPALEIAATAKADPDPNYTPLAAVVKSITTAIQRVSTPAHIREVMDLIEVAPDVSDILPGWNSHFSMDFTVTSWANMGGVAYEEADFGEAVGRVKYLRVPRADTDGTMVVLPRRRHEEVEEEGIEVVVPLHEEDMKALEGDAVWRRFFVSR